MAAHQRKKRFVEREFKKNPFCPICGVLMVLPGALDEYPNIKNFPHNLATYEHTYSRLHPLRGEHTRNRIICWLCNFNNGVKDEMEFLPTAHKRKK